MTYTFTDTPQIEEFMPANLDDLLFAVDLVLEDRYQLGGGDFCLSGDNEWATDDAIKGILEGKTPEQIAQGIADQWEPSDADMMAAFGTKWHDGL